MRWHTRESGCLGMAQPTLVRRPVQSYGGAAMGTPPSTGPVDTGAWLSVAPSAGALETDGLAAERIKHSAAGLSDTVVGTIQSARAPSTRSLYTLKWHTFAKWCSPCGHDPFQCSVSVVLSFLQELLEQGKAALAEQGKADLCGGYISLPLWHRRYQSRLPSPCFTVYGRS